MERPKKVLVVGLGVSGQAACQLLVRQGHAVVATDLRERSELGAELLHLEKIGCQLELGEHKVQTFIDVDQIIVSPGVPLEIPPLREARKRGVEIIGELDWAWLQTKTPVIAVTGTNGKTTTTLLIGECLRRSGKRIFVGGNIGSPLSRWILSGEAADFLVLEVSSFQLDTAFHFRPEIGVLLNLTEDHLDRYSDFAAYVDSKFSLFTRQDESHVAIVNLDDPICRQRAGEIKGKTLLFSRNDSGVHAYVQGDSIVVNLPGRDPFSLSLERTALRGVHNQENIMGAVLAACEAGAESLVIQDAIDHHAGLPHRLEWVGSRRGVDFYDDSKATNVGAVLKALESFDRPVLLLMGGRDKLGSYAPLKAALTGRVKRVFVYGEAAPRMFREFKQIVPTLLFPNLQSAFAKAAKMAEPGDVVLLSPACSSFDQYESYAERGDHFKTLVQQLPS